MKLQDRIAIVIGASSGIGRACAVALAREGARVVVVGRDAGRLQPVLAELEALRPGGHLALAADVMKPENLERVATQTIATFGTIDILVYSAGSGGSLALQREIPFALVQLPEEEWDEIIDTNLKGSFFAMKAVLPQMMKQHRGDIVNIGSSRGARIALPFTAAYAASKRGLMGLVGAASEELLAYNIRVQTLLPDVTDTPMMREHASITPQGLLPTGDVADFLIHLLTLPGDTLLLDPILLPYKGTD